MRIALLTSHAKTLTNFRLELIESLIERKHIVFALAPDFDLKTRSVMIELGVLPVDVRLSRTGSNPFTDIVDTFNLVIILRKLSLDMLFSYSTKPVIYGSISAFIARVEKRISMIEGLGYAFTDSIYSQKLKQRALKKLVTGLYKIALTFSTKILFLNNDDLNQFVDFSIVKKEKSILFGGIGVNLDYWRAIVPVSTPVTFILVARILREKGIYEYLEAVRNIKAQFPKIRFVIIGDLDSNPGAISKNEITSWVSEGLIEWPGYVNTKNWLEKASVFVLPSYREGVPRSTQEAMALGLPVITTDVPGCRETVCNNSNGFLIPEKDSKALEMAMLKFIEKPSLIEFMGKQSRILAEKKFDVKIKTKMLISIIEK